MEEVLAGLDERLRRAEDAARGRGRALRAPVLVLGIAERVGSDRLTDLWRASLVVHNEPLQQQVCAGLPLPPLDPHVIDVTGQDGPVETTGLSGLARPWLVTFVVGKYTTGRRHLVKETSDAGTGGRGGVRRAGWAGVARPAGQQRRVRGVAEPDAGRRAVQHSRRGPPAGHRDAR